MRPTFVTTAEPHATDGVLLALIDGEPSAGADEHVAQCPTCAARLDQLRRCGEQVSASVEAIPVPSFAAAAAMREGLVAARSDHRTRQPRFAAAWTSRTLRLAASIVFVAGVAWASPARSWLARHFGSSEPNEIAPSADVRTPIGENAPNAPGMVVRFAPAGEELVVRFDARPTRGALEVLMTTDEQISARISTGAASEEMIVLPGELRIHNSAASTADYRLTVPAGVRRLRVVIGDRVIRVTPRARELIQLTSASLGGSGSR